MNNVDSIDVLSLPSLPLSQKGKLPSLPGVYVVLEGIIVTGLTGA